MILINGTPFKANNAGQWDLTDIWQTLKLPKGKAPGQWRTREAERLLTMQNLHSERSAKENRLHATKRATLEYAGWVSSEFKDMVYDAFEAILELPDVALLVAEKMSEVGRTNSAQILRRIAESDKEARQVALKLLNKGRKPRKLTPQEEEVKRLSRRAARFENKQRRY